MLEDRSKYEQDLIFAVCGLDIDERTAIRFAYQILRKGDGDET